MSSYLKTSMRAGIDKVDGLRVMHEGEEVIVNSVAYGYENVTNMMLKTLRETRLQPRDCLLVFEGMQSKSKRLLIDASYKSGRDKQPAEFYSNFAELRDYIESEWMAMGAISLKQDFAEGDDTLAFLAAETEEDLIIATRDSDMGALCTEEGGTNAHGATVTVYNDGLIGMVKIDGEPWVHPYKYITLYKALVGDTSDSIPGVPGIGKAAFHKLAEKYGYDGLDQLIGLLQKGNLDPLHEVADEVTGKDKPVHPLIKKIVTAEAAAIRSYQLAKMYPEWVNTMRQPLQIKAGKMEELVPERDERLHEFFGRTRLVLADNYDDALVFFREMLQRTPEPTFDIETSTPPESDDWLLAQGNPDGVDQIGSKLTGFSFTFGPNMQYTFYVSVEHARTANIKMSQAREFIEAACDTGKPIIIQNNMFELGVLWFAEDEDGTLWREEWAKRYPDFNGFLPNSLDTKLEASYVNENLKLGLKQRSSMHLGYEQVSYEAVTTKIGRPDELPPGGRLKAILEADENEVPLLVKRQYKMNELTALEVISYGADDTICTDALHNYYKFVMGFEHTWDVYLETEIAASYQHAHNFVKGMAFSLQRSKELERDDDATFDAAWGTVRAYLMQHGWQGTVPPLYGPDITAKEIKEAYAIIKGATDEPDDEEEEVELEDEEGSEPADGDEGGSAGGDSAVQVTRDAFLSTRVRTPSKLVALAMDQGHTVFAGMLEDCLGGGYEKFTAWVNEHFTGEPQFKTSNKQMTHLLYDVMKLPVRITSKPTKIMRAKGITQGNPKADALAIEYALRDATPEQKAVLEALKLMTMVKTRRGLYYTKYPYFVHWKTGMIHPSHNQCATNTRRASEAKPNKQQLSKHTKIEGQAAKFRETIVPHHPDAVIVSLDFDSQELRIIADYSKDANMVACYVGEHKMDMHSITGQDIAYKKKKTELGYDEFAVAAKDKTHPENKVCKEYRALGKKVNFTTEFGAMAPKLAQTMLVTEAEAQEYINSKERKFPGVVKWKDSVIAQAKRIGFVRTMEGAMRHLGWAFMSDDHWIKSKAERQSVNTKVQGSAAAMTKRSEGRMWHGKLFFEFDAVCYGPVHDEIVASVMVKDLPRFIEKMHWCMVQPFGGMEIPIESSISVGFDFGRQIEMGNKPDLAALHSALTEMGYTGPLPH